MSLIAPGRSAGSSFRRFSSGAPAASLADEGDEDGAGESRFVPASATDPVVPPVVDAVDEVVLPDEGFFSPLRDGGGGASSIRPCERNWELYVLTVFTRFSGLRTSIEIEAFLLPPTPDIFDEELLAELLPVSEPLSLPPSFFELLRERFAMDDLLPPLLGDCNVLLESLFSLLLLLPPEWLDL